MVRLDIYWFGLRKEMKCRLLETGHLSLFTGHLDKSIKIDTQVSG